MESATGRESELARIDAVRREARHGSGRLVLVTGEAGIGKSWLARAVVDAARADGMATARGWCLDDAAGPPLWMWRRAARHLPNLLPTLEAFGRGAGDTEARLRLCDAAAGHLADASTDRGLVLVLEDLHWADEVSLDLLRRLGVELEGLPVLMIATARADVADGPFGAVLPQLVRASIATQVALEGLDEQSVRRWLALDDETAAWAPRAAEVVGLTGGNPFYVRSLVTELRATPKADVEAALTRRPAWRTVLAAPLAGLPPQTRRAITQAAVLGERLAPTIVAAAMGRAVDEVSEQLETGVRSGLLHFAESGLAFRHALVREAIVASMSAIDLAECHARAARALEDTEDPLLRGLAAAHWSHIDGQDAARRCRDLASAAARASAFAPERGIELARLAVSAARALDVGPGELAQDLLLQARLEWAAGRLHAALATCASVQDLAEPAGRPDLMADAALVPQGVGSVDIANHVVHMCRRGLAVLPAAETDRAARLLALRAVSSIELRQLSLFATAPTGSAAAQDPEDPDEVCKTALALAQRGNDPQAELETLAARHFVLSHPMAITERTRLAARAVDLAPSATTTMGALWGQLWTADLAFQRGETHAVRACIDAIDDVADRRASPIARWHGLRLRAALDFLEGRLDAARRTALEARQVADRVGDLSMSGMHQAFHVNLALLRGDPNDLLPDWKDVIRRAPPMPLVRISLVLIHALLGEFDRARETLEPFRWLPERFPLGPRWLGTVGQIGFAAVLVGDASLARSCYEALLPCAPWCAGDGGGSPFAGGSTERALGDLALTFGDLPRAAAHFERAMAVNDRIGAVPDAARARLGLAHSLASAAPERAAGLARMASTELTSLGMPGPAADAARLVRRFDHSATGQTGRPDGLTQREAEVAALVGQALTNQQIADRLFVSVRTVESHVRSILAKIGATTRTEIAVWVRDRP